jgi:hypothetical protein
MQQSTWRSYKEESIQEGGWQESSLAQKVKGVRDTKGMPAAADDVDGGNMCE